MLLDQGEKDEGIDMHAPNAARKQAELAIIDYHDRRHTKQENREHYAGCEL